MNPDQVMASAFADAVDAAARAEEPKERLLREWWCQQVVNMAGPVRGLDSPHVEEHVKLNMSIFADHMTRQIQKNQSLEDRELVTWTSATITPWFVDLLTRLYAASEGT